MKREDTRLLSLLQVQRMGEHTPQDMVANRGPSPAVGRKLLMAHFPHVALVVPFAYSHLVEIVASTLTMVLKIGGFELGRLRKVPGE